jgi:hypothetical protein
MTPRAEYTQRMESRRAAVERLERRHIRIGNLRLGVAVAAAVIAYLAFARGLVSPLWLVPAGVAFLILVLAHERVIRARRRADRAVRFYERALARIDNAWAGSGEGGERFSNAAHPYAEDLDLFGAGSLFELLSTVRTRAGEETLARWLLEPAPPAVVRARQAAIEELRTKLDLREDLAVLGEEVRVGVHPDALTAWGEHAVMLDSSAARMTAAVLSLLGLTALAAWAVWGWRDVAVVAVLVNSVFFLRFRRSADAVADAADAAAHDLELLAEVLARLEREPFKAPRLVELRSGLGTDGPPPSAHIRGLARLISLLDSRHHMVVRGIEPVVFWTIQFAFAVESWRKRSGRSVRRWLEAVGEMEALAALAGYAYEHPADPFPEFVEGGPVLEGEGLAHPLLAESSAVRNDFQIGNALRLVVISGSNMSGKSTLLRTIGINVVLAQAGAPVRATRLRLSPLALGASIRIVDSLQRGSSRFYAEITRLRQIVELTQGELPLLFLLDEFLQGTNSHDRRLGAEAIVRGLIEAGAVGLLTTHDLALTEVAAALGAQAVNVHFEDRLENGRLLFDYRLRPGVVQRSNALELMRSVGLKVDRV